MTFHEIIKQAVTSLCGTLNAYLPGDITKKEYEAGLDLKANFQTRMEIAVYIELVKAGIINDSNYQNN